MKAKYISKIHYPNGKVTTHEDKLGTSPRFWNNQLKLSANDKVKMNYATKSIGGKPVVTSVRSDYKDGTYMTTTLLNSKQLNKKTVSRGKAFSHKKNSLSSLFRKNKRLKG